jgi:hypothetical protein
LQDSNFVKRIWIAALLVGGATIPALLMAAFLFGCCVLPFHHVVHRVFPFCGGIVKLLTPQPHHDAVPSKPASKHTIGAAIVVKRAVAAFMRDEPLVVTHSLPPRDRLAHGAVRCDDDVGLYLLVSILRI